VQVTILTVQVTILTVQVKNPTAQVTILTVQVTILTVQVKNPTAQVTNPNSVGYMYREVTQQAQAQAVNPYMGPLSRMS
jgi:hypothetical protein